MDIRYRTEGCESLVALERAIRRKGFPLTTVTFIYYGGEHKLLSINNIPLGTPTKAIDAILARERRRYRRWMKKWRV